MRRPLAAVQDSHSALRQQLTLHERAMAPNRHALPLLTRRRFYPCKRVAHVSLDGQLDERHVDRWIAYDPHRLLAALDSLDLTQQKATVDNNPAIGFTEAFRTAIGDLSLT